MLFSPKIRSHIAATSFVLLLTTVPLCCQQVPPAAAAKAKPPYVGDAPENAGPMATDLSSDLRPGAIRKAMLKVGDWQLRQATGKFSRSWEFGAMYTGYVAAGETLLHPKYLQAMTYIAETLDWKLNTPDTNPDNQAVALMFLDLAAREHRQNVLESIEGQFDHLLATQQDTHPWSWCDTLFMAPPVWARLYELTGDKRYLEYIDREWWDTTAKLYVPDEKLFLRDATYENKHESNGKRIFWARGNGWVLAGLVQVLQADPATDSAHARYVSQFREMASKIAQLQQPDGSWHASLLDPQSYDQPENSGTAFFVYGLAWGINHRLLDRATYEPIVAAGWKELVTHIYADGRLGNIQQGGGSPAHFSPSASYVYGVGAFLLAGSEVFKLAHA